VKTIIVNVENHSGTLQLGRVGENNARQIVFDCAAFEREYGPGAAQLFAKLPSGEKYPVVTEQTGSAVVWTIGAADVGCSGNGKAELSWLVGDTVAKTTVWKTQVLASLTGTESEVPPAPYRDWVDKITEVGRQATEDAGTAEQAAQSVLDTKGKVDRLAGLGPFLVLRREE
jgi:hypothetical protein